MTAKSLFDLTGQVAVVTGASSGLGKQMAIALAEHGADLAILARRVEKLNETAEAIRNAGRKCLVVKCDVTSTENVQEAVEAVIQEYGKVDIVINNAGTGAVGPAEEMDDETWQWVMDVDLTGAFKVAREFGKEMLKKQYGRIVNIASMYGMVGNSEAPAAGYHAAKGGVVNLTRALAAEWGPRGVTVNAICPGYFETELTSDTLRTDEFTAYMQRTVPVQRYGREGELNTAAIFLAAPASGYVNGVILPVDGGYTCV